MRTKALPLLCLLATIPSTAQQPSSVDKQKAQSARARYYSLPGAGFQGFSCSVVFDWKTVPQLPAIASEPTASVLAKTQFKLVVDHQGGA
ncbi:MAG: hypothetical protein V4555_19835, partial [Acidobacteriota bacterium]